MRRIHHRDNLGGKLFLALILAVLLYAFFLIPAKPLDDNDTGDMPRRDHRGGL